MATMNTTKIALWDGMVSGCGLGLSCYSPIRIATENAIFSIPQNSMGTFIFNGSSYFLSRLKKNVNLGLYLALTGHQLCGEELVQWGIATHFVPSDKID